MSGLISRQAKPPSCVSLSTAVLVLRARQCGAQSSRVPRAAAFALAARQGRNCQTPHKVEQASGAFKIAGLKILPGNGSAATTIDLQLIKPLDHVANFAVANGVAEMTADGAYPVLLVRLPQLFIYHPRPADLLGFWPRALAIWAICFLLVIAAATAMRWFFARPMDSRTGARMADNRVLAIAQG